MHSPFSSLNIALLVEEDGGYSRGGLVGVVHVLVPMIGHNRYDNVRSDGTTVMGDEKFRSLNMVNNDVGSDYLRNAVDTCDIILRVKPDLLSRLMLVSAGAA